ncbi:MAG: nucleotidyltransferase family protein [Hyphomicrobium sp.]|uniref:nucleotidyltransferase family protein n=1 Tax=Hyphomicrobium sp. TaxID=82 RepID=UPI001321A825|nr:nucleotidyltransferase family protein [Hyphomicrobium sp.]KAB2941846.1 MAG: nucleotidyltransferase family protein [Hyphomicrobium sp.]MBZ0210588.1 nucleotidyltransferase family protein [Hyphomicrobium sp.]
MSTSSSWRPQAAMVLAGGMGKRMLPLTKDIPKPMVRLRGRPLIDHVLDRIAAAGVGRAVVNVHYCADKLEAHVRQRKRPQILISDERQQLLDTGGGVTKALPLLGPEPFLIHNSDSVWIEGVGSNLERLFSVWNPDIMDSLMLLASAATSLGYEGPGDFAMDKDGRLERRGERQMVPFVFTGVSIAHPRMFEGAPQGPFSINQLWDAAIDNGRLFGIRLDGLWMHVGTPEALIEAERWIESEDVA